MKKTLAMKVLEGRNVPFEPFTYPASERDAVKIADHFGVPHDQVFKSLVVARPHKKPLLVMIPANYRLNLKKLAKATGDKKLKMSTHAEAEKLTGLQVGGISPLALLNKGSVMLIDRVADQHDEIFVSAGQKGINLKVSRKGLVKVVAAKSIDTADLDQS